jgi:hypothetical protein
MSSEPQVIGSTATQNFTERVLPRRQADLLSVYEVVGLPPSVRTALLPARRTASLRR